MSRRLTLGALAFLATTSLALTAGAGGRPADELFARGRAAVLAGRFDEACPALEESLRLEPGIGTALWLADCYEKSARRLEAWSTFRRAAELARERGDVRSAVAERRAAILEEALPRLTIVPPEGAEGLVVHRDGVAIDAAALGAPVPVGPGAHVVTATAKGREKWSTRVEVPDAPKTVRVEIVFAEGPATAPAVAAAAVRRDLGPGKAPGSAEAPIAVRLGAIATGAVGLTALGVGVVYGLGASASYDESNEGGHCTGRNLCTAEGKRLRGEAHEEATVSTIAFGAGAIALGAAVALWIFSTPSREPRPPTAAWLRSVGVGPGGASFRHTW